MRRLRGTIGMGLTWGLAWSVAGFGLAIITRFQADAPFPLVFFVFGFLAGITFSVLLSLIDGRRRFEQMSMPRFVGWGAAGGVVLATIFSWIASFGVGDVLTVVPTFALASAACASGSLALARRAVGSAERSAIPNSPTSAIASATSESVRDGSTRLPSRDTTPTG